MLAHTCSNKTRGSLWTNLDHFLPYVSPESYNFLQLNLPAGSVSYMPSCWPAVSDSKRFRCRWKFCFTTAYSTAEKTASSCLTSVYKTDRSTITELSTLSVICCLSVVESIIEHIRRKFPGLVARGTTLELWNRLVSKQHWTTSRSHCCSSTFTSHLNHKRCSQIQLFCYPDKLHLKFEILLSLQRVSESTLPSSSSFLTPWLPESTHRKDQSNHGWTRRFRGGSLRRSVCQSWRVWQSLTKA